MKGMKSVAHMKQTANFVLTSYDLPKIDGAISNIRRNVSRMRITLGDPEEQNISWLKGKPKMWGCSGDDIKIKTILVSGSSEELKKLNRIKAPDGVFTQLLLTKK